MGRKIPTVENTSSIQPILSLSLLVVGIAATISIVSSLCGALSRKKSHPPTNSQIQIVENSDIVISPTNEVIATKTETSKESSIPTPLEVENSFDMPNEEQPLPLPPPPGMLRGTASYHYRSHSTASQGRFSSSMSMRVLGRGLGSRQQSRRGENHEKMREKNLKHEDSIWKKTIILGEKCKIPDEDEDAILYDENGNRISTYHPKTPTSLPVSRQTSYIDQDAISAILQGQERK